ncbi:DNA cytosine methyltransferase [Herbaspirillum sp.]|uniref:DNA cytosine methyltransferase n=1 Tax=Herbaspirillum sp. TaxID=1890675 RepID=UPI000C0A228F|nr:DNA cytosine methyltransferase [Herbaspirillum sp.]MAF05582.1 DNA cytosine methyltransferase [Herbaspirillum sp.]MBO17774.1 DNA cytosine methyltransferase [Herbaspirillum sp.]
MKRDIFSGNKDDIREVRHFHLFGAIGGGARGFSRASARVGNMVAKFRCIGSVDVDAAANRDFGRLVGVPATTLDLFDLDQYLAFHGHMPPPGWREALPVDICRAAGGERPHIVFLSAPCKGFSGLLAEGKSKTDKYQALNRLTLRGVWLMLEAWADDPPELIIFENVPRIATRGRHLLDQIVSLLRRYGYATAETTHDCGEIGGLAQSRKRFLLVGRHMAKVPNFLYEPPKRSLLAVGDILGRMPLPGDPAGGPMHRIPALQWKTWVRLAFVEAGKDWRSLNRLAIEDGHLRDYLIVPEYHNGFMGVRSWEEPTGTVAGRSNPSNGTFSVADPRAAAGAAEYQQYGVLDWRESSGAVIGVKSPGQGTFSVADPRAGDIDTTHKNVYRVVEWDRAAGTVTSGHGPSSGGQSVADPRHSGPAKHSNEFRIAEWDKAACAVTSAHGTGQAVADPRRAGESFGKYGVTPWKDPAGTVISGSTTGQGAFAVADPRAAREGKLFSKYPVAQWVGASGTVIGGDDTGAYAIADPRPAGIPQKGDHYLTGGHYGVLPMDAHSGAVASAASYDNGRWSVADPRMPAAADKLVCVIRALDGTWHRPFTTLELAALQSLVDPEEMLELDGLSDQAWRERIGNAVPPAAAEAIASEMGRTLLLAWSGETFQLSAAPIWVRPVAVAMNLTQGDQA